MKKISLVLCVTMLLAMFASFGVFAVDLPDFYVEDATVTPGETFTAKLGVKGLSADAAMDTFGVTMTYPEGFTYVSSAVTAAVADVCQITLDGVTEPTYWIEHDADARTITLVAVVNTVDLATTGIATDGILLTADFTAPAEADFAADGYTFTATAMESGFVDLTGQTVEVTVTDGNITKTVTVLKGDANGDGSIALADYLMTLAYVKTDGNTIPNNFNKEAADVNGDDAVTLADYLMILAYVKSDGNTVPWNN